MISKKSRPAEDEGRSYMDKLTRTIYIVGEITPRSAIQFRRCIKALERRKGNILVEINSQGGDIESGLVIIDTIALTKKTVVTRVTGAAASMAALILASGDKREATPSSSVMIHYGSYTVSGRYDELDNEMQEVKRLEKLCNDVLDSKTGKKSGYWEKASKGKNYYMDPQKALKENIIDKILSSK